MTSNSDMRKSFISVVTDNCTSSGWRDTKFSLFTLVNFGGKMTSDTDTQKSCISVVTDSCTCTLVDAIQNFHFFTLENFGGKMTSNSNMQVMYLCGNRQLYLLWPPWSTQYKFFTFYVGEFWGKMTSDSDSQKSCISVVTANCTSSGHLGWRDTKFSLCYIGEILGQNDQRQWHAKVMYLCGNRQLYVFWPPWLTQRKIGWVLLCVVSPEVGRASTAVCCHRDTWLSMVVLKMLFAK